MPPRSWLFVPGNSMKMMQKALASGADALILDLEDAVPPGEKAAARACVAEFLRSGAERVPCFVRVNALQTGMSSEDVEAVRGQAKGFVLPKCEGPHDLAAFATMTAQAPAVAIATETARAVRSLMAEDWSHPTLIGLAWGAEDLAADLGAAANRNGAGEYHSPFRLARDTMLIAAKAAGVAAIDAVRADFRDAGGLSAEAREAEAVGFTGKLAIHPAQIAPIHAAFTPAPERIDWATRVVAAFREAGGGVASLDGRMIDRPHLKQAEAILARTARDPMG